MSEPAPPTRLHAALAGLDARERAIVTGMFTVMAGAPTRVREREWMAEQLVAVTVAAGGFEAESGPAAVEAVGAYLRPRSQALLDASLLLFQRVALELAPRAAAGFSFDDALALALDHLATAEARR